MRIDAEVHVHLHDSGDGGKYGAVLAELVEIKRMLMTLREQGDALMTQEEDLNVALDALGLKVDAIGTAVGGLKQQVAALTAQLEARTDVDLIDEIAKAQAITARLQAIEDQVATPPVTPA